MILKQLHRGWTGVAEEEEEGDWEEELQMEQGEGVEEEMDNN